MQPDIFNPELQYNAPNTLIWLQKYPLGMINYARLNVLEYSRNRIEQNGYRVGVKSLRNEIGIKYVELYDC